MPTALNRSLISVLVVSSGRFPINNLTGISNDPSSGMVGSRPNGSREHLGGGACARKTFGSLQTEIYYFEGELCVSDNLEDSRGADEESELSSIPIHITLGRCHCQPQQPS